jgi:hypothetical protein
MKSTGKWIFFPHIPKDPKREDFTLNILLEQGSLITCQPKCGKTKREAVTTLEQFSQRRQQLG